MPDRRPFHDAPRETAPPEPDATAAGRARHANRFVLRHRANEPLAWDLRLENDDDATAATDWRLPRGLPWKPGAPRAASPEPVGAAPAGRAWDKGRADVALAGRDELVLDLAGRRVRGRYALRRAPTGDADAWAVERLDPASVQPMPDRVLPMLARAGEYPKAPARYAFEMKWDGIRALAHVHRDGHLVLRSRSLATITKQYPELAALPDALRGHDVVLDGEIVAFDDNGHPSFQRLQSRLGVTDGTAARQKARDTPVVFVAFDLLHLDGQDATSLPYEERRNLLDSLQISARHWQVPPFVLSDGRALLTIPGAEGVVAKELGSAYEPGARAATWIKIKQQRRQEVVIGGFTRGKGARRGAIGALLVGYYDEEGNLRYGGNVGTGFSEKTLDDLARRFAPIVRASSPFADKTSKDATFVEPALVAEVEFTEWTTGGRLRHPSYKGLRFDKDPREVVREE